MASVPPRLHHVLTATLLLLVLVVVFWRTRPDGRLHIFFLDTPGDAVLIQTPAGSYVLIDGGEDPANLALHLGRTLPFWKRTLAAVVLTQGDHARLAGQVAALSRYHTELALVPGVWHTPAGGSMHLVQALQETRSTPGSISNSTAVPDDTLIYEWLRLIDDQHTRLLVAQPGYQLPLDGVLLTVLTTGNEDESRLVLQLDYGATRVVFAGAASEADDAMLLASAQPVTLLAYPWQREIQTPLVEAWYPRAVVFTTAYEAAKPAEQSYYDRSLYGSALYHQRIDGTIELVSDGRHSWITTEQTEQQ